MMKCDKQTNQLLDYEHIMPRIHKGTVQTLSSNGLTTHTSPNKLTDAGMLTEYKSVHTVRYFCSNHLNRHLECNTKQPRQKNIETVTSEAQLVSPVTVRNNPLLRAKPSITRNDKKRLVNSFNINKLEYFQSSPMVPIYNLFKDRYKQRERDRVHQQRLFDCPNEKEISQAIQYTVQQVLSTLSVDEHFKIRLQESDFKRFIMRQPKLIQQSLDFNGMVEMQSTEVESGLEVNRKIQLILSVFADPHFDAKDRELLYQVLMYQIEHAQNQAAKMEKVGLIKGLSRFQNKKETKYEQLGHVKQYLLDNFTQLVKLQ